MIETTEAHAPLVQRLAREFGATWVDETSVADWSAGGGDRVVLLAGDPVRFPEGVDVAAVLPELMKSFPNRFRIAVVPRDSEDAVAKRYGSQRWPTLLFFRDGQYVTAIAGMQDWDVYLSGVAAALAMPPSRPPTIGIPVVSQTGGSSCH
ncbi:MULTISPECIES: thioredoxin domain-containing protein [Burkholderiales]|jgi:hydrogenase-1 operon protein HyaE|uniref:Hydrogenase expression/formation protein n=1 Tax=Cupriavidus metallidurans (strain ATCC 43123 / DSM 2839 / NBRC 102507 / CH34) TaxID=266264 RepID=Q1LNV0_CUPMC|nr:hydrogenase [Cupriavidus metallidurans]ABF08176.1 HoxO Hydrogenase expression/formation protein hoxO (belongs to CMGI-2) [Cupriavidus metallidurans CH34]QGS27556.1 hydrogenase [Cupriavidus metallidurans]